MTCKQERGKLTSKWEQIRFFNHNISNNQLLILTVKIINDQLKLLGGQHLKFFSSYCDSILFIQLCGKTIQIVFLISILAVT